MIEVVCLGELLIDFVSIDRDVSLIESTGFQKAPGGAPANVAVGVKKLQVNSSFVGKVGKDPFGYYLKEVLDGTGVDTSGLVFDEAAKTTLSFVANKSDGIRDCVFYRNPGADMLLEPFEVSENLFKAAKIFHYGSISLGSEKSKAATLKAIEYAKVHKLVISYDPNYRPDLWKDKEKARNEMNQAIQYADFVKISEEEFEFITGCKTVEECAAYILSKGPKLVAITLGGKGCFYSDGIHQGYLDGFAVQTVETTGAGDAFVAAVLKKIVERIDFNLKVFPENSEELVEMMVFANAAGALATTKVGAIPSMPSVEEVMQLIKKVV